MNGPEIAIGSRGSALALAQAKLVYEALEHEGHASRVVIIETEGDRRAPDTAWGEGAFVAAIERALQGGVIDVAKGHDVAVLGGVGGVAGPLAAHADAGEVDLFVGGLAPGRLRGVGDPEADAR